MKTVKETKVEACKLCRGRHFVSTDLTLMKNFEGPDILIDNSQEDVTEICDCDTTALIEVTHCPECGNTADFDLCERDLYDPLDAFCDNPGDDQCECGISTVSGCHNPNCRDYPAVESDGVTEALDELHADDLPF